MVKEVFMIKIKKNLQKVLIAEDHSIYYWDPTFYSATLFPVNVTDQVKDFKEAIDVKESDFDLIYLDNANQINFIEFGRFKSHISPFSLILPDNIHISLMTTDDALLILLSNNKLIFAFQEENGTIAESTLGEIEEIYSYKQVPIDLPKDTIILDIDIFSTRNETRITILTIDNTVYVYTFDLYNFMWKKNETCEIPLSISGRATSINDDKNDEDYTTSRGFIIKTSDEIYYHCVWIKEDVTLKSFDCKVINPNLYEPKKISFNRPLLLQKQPFTLNPNGEVFFNPETNQTKRIKVMLPMNKDEKIISLVRASEQIYTALTSHGKLFALGFSQNRMVLTYSSYIENQDKVNPILLNDFLGREPTWNDFQDLVESREDRDEIFKTIFSKISTKLIQEKKFQKYILESIDMIHNVSFSEDILYPDFILQLCDVYPEFKYQFLHTNLNIFKMGNKALSSYQWYSHRLSTAEAERLRKQAFHEIVNVEIPKFSIIFPDYILLYHEDYIGRRGGVKNNIPLETYIKFLKPIMKNEHGEIKNFASLFGVVNKAFGLEHLTDNLTLLSVNFLLALAKLGMIFNFVSYPYLLGIDSWLDKNSSSNGLSEEVLMKLQTDCILIPATRISLKKQVQYLVNKDLYLLSERLIANELIPLSKFVSEFKLNPNKFSIKFRGLMLQGQSKKILKPTNDLSIDNQSISYLGSTRNTIFINVGEHFYIIGDIGDSLLLPGANKKQLKPYCLDNYFKDFISFPFKFFTSYEDGFLFIDDL
jgi:hypothetical protein